MERPLEMVKARLAVLSLAVLLLSSCGYRYSWEKFEMDGHRTGVKAPNAVNVSEALGVYEGGVYTSPNGTRFQSCATSAVAADLISVQPQMSALKEVIGYASMDMIADRPESNLSNWFVDRLMVDVARLTGKKVDFGITNFGGIRVDLAEGEILKDDIVSMFPFRNYLTYVALKGEDVKALFDQMSEQGVQALGGVKYVVADGKTELLEIGGEPLDLEKVYGVATIDFLLDGGDGLSVAKNAKELIITDKMIIDCMLPYVKELTEAGRPVEYHTDGRVVVK